MTKDTSIFQRAVTAAKFLVKGGISGAWVTVLGGGSSGSNYNVSEGSKAMTRSAILAACIGRWGIEYPQVRMVVKNRKGEPDYEHAFMRIIDKPNELMDQSEFLAIISIYRCLTGTAYIHKLRNLIGTCVGYEPMHAYELVKGYDTPGVHTHYTFTSSTGMRKRVPLEDVVAMPWVVRNPADVSTGLSPLQSCWSEHVAYAAINEFVAQFISNGAVPGTAFIAKGDFAGDEDDKKKFKEDLQYRYGLKSGGVGGSILLEGDFDVKRISANLSELALEGLRDTPEANICMAFFVPPELIGVNVGLQNSTYSNKKEARRGFAENILSPMWENDASRLTKILTDDFKGTDGWYVEPDLSRVAALKEDEDKRLDRAMKGFEKNLFYRDQALAIAGYSPEDNAKVYAVDLLKPATPIGKALHGQPRVKSVEERDALWKSLDDDRMKHVKALSKALAKGVETLKASVINSAKSAVGAKRDPRPPTDAELRRIFLEGTEEERTNMAKEMMARAVKDADFDPDEIKSWLDGVVDESVAASANNITKAYGTMRDEIVEVVKANAGKTKEEIEAALSEYFEILGNRIATIAQTTATNATTVAQQGAWKNINKRREDKKVIKQMWLSMRDGKVRTDHAARDGETFEIGEELDGTLGPGLGTEPSDVINCRCVLTPITETKG